MKGSSIEGKAVCKKSKQPRSSRSRRWFQWHSESWDFLEIWRNFHLTSCVCVCPFPSRAAICEDPDFWMFQDLLVAETHHWICCGDPCGNCHGEKSCVFALTSKIQRCWSFTWNQSREVSLRIHRKELAVFSTWSADPLECIWFCEKRWLPLDTELTWLAKTARSLQKTAKMWEKMAETNTEAKLKITNLEAYGLELPPNSLGVEKGMTYQQE